jgi:cytidylate kinase
MPNLVVIFGPPASGKAAVGYELARLTGYRFFHNHLTADPAAALFGWGGERFGRMVDTLRDVLFREAASDPSIPGVVFTYAWGLNLPGDTALMTKISGLFAETGGQVFFVELLASLETRLAREGTPFRVGLKPELRDAVAARARQHEYAAKFIMNTDGTIPLNYPHLVIDTENIAPDAAATHVKKAFALPDSDA